MAKSPRRPSTRARRTVREELSDPPTHEELSETLSGVADADDAEDTITTPTPKAAPRLSIPLTADGTAPDWARMRNADKAREVLGLGGAASEASGGADAGVFGADMLGLALDALASGLVSVARAGGYTADSSELLRFSEQEKAALIPRAVKVLEKHAPSLGKWEDEIALAVTASIIIGGKLMALKKAGTVTKFPQRVPTPEPAPTTTVIDPDGGPVNAG